MGSDGYISELHYMLLDNLNYPLPTSVPLNEQFTSLGAILYAGSNWYQPPPGGDTWNPDNWFDSIRVYGTELVPQAMPPANGDTQVIRWDGQWLIGRAVPGCGLRVQTNTWMLYRDHGRHINIVSPSDRIGAAK